MALANKETLVIGGKLIQQALARSGGELIPVDSEHSAALQCLGGRPASEIARLTLTASGRITSYNVCYTKLLREANRTT